MKTTANQSLPVIGRACRVRQGAPCAPDRCRHPRRDLAFVWLLFATAAAPFARAATNAPPPPASEYEIKAALILNFARFVDWPAGAFANANAPVVIGILGEDPFGKILDDTVQGETVKNHPLVVRRSRRLDDLRQCQLLFISNSEKGRLAQLLFSLHGSGTLTVGETDGFVRLGGIINLTITENRVRFEINPANATEGGLTISAKLLRLASVVGSPPSAETR